MIYNCPFCGYNVSRAIKNGITTCNHCNRVFDSSSYCKVLSTSWFVRKNNLCDIETVKSNFELTDFEAGLIEKYIINEDYCHDDFIKALKTLNFN